MQVGNERGQVRHTARGRRAPNFNRFLRTGYYIDDFQATYFVIDRFEDLFALMRETDFLELYTRLRTEPELTPFEIGPEDVVVREGTGDYWRGFSEEKGLK
ncbi:hypothetical protein Ga0061061_11142 [Chelatococcus sambhunathii]|uniref:Uncharacterized protein n=1 Tax=Chelatococcus sambhunathii TaxID=363953 RepID=A0ABP2A7I9_9HYPH|nr:hypothetical protein [Chelatococcus sambhunathii]CUA90081.1 hypothetical protein Ga0061061_11142 [Chelatococcus sambhunathii]